MNSIDKDVFIADHKNDKIFYWKNVISNPSKILEDIDRLEKDESSYIKIEKWLPWTASDSNSNIYGDLKTFYPQNIYAQTINQQNDIDAYNIINNCAIAFNMCFSLYFKEHGINIENYNIEYNWLVLKRWNIGSKMGPHFDGSYGKENKLEFTAILYFNDDYEGGELYFNDQNILLKPEAGSMVVFPGSFTHEVKEIKGNYRYMMSISAYKK
jgi:hypothetical protein